ncbi:MAG: N-acetylglucosamine-6-phosphate deacetylase [Chloroflexota bacterium]|nr:N-acetylglucosamine-6-phosphate deacetylase [Chloroflexota bacterium]
MIDIGTTPRTITIRGRLVLEEGVAPGRIELEAGRIASVILEPGGQDGPFVSPGFVDIHVHGWGGHDAMGDDRELEAMARALLARGVTGFLPTAMTSSHRQLVAFADRMRRWQGDASAEGAEPLGFNIEGPCISPVKRGAQNPAHIQAPAAYDEAALVPLLDGLRIMTVAPELPGAIELIERLTASGVVVALGHSNATTDEAAAGYLAGARSTTHLFNAMSGADHHAPGLAVTALTTDSAAVELIADGLHVDPALWPMVLRAKPADRVILVSDAIRLAGAGDGRFSLAGVEVEVRDMACRVVSDGRLAGSVNGLDMAVRNLVHHGIPLPVAVGAATRNPLDLLGIRDRGRLAVGQCADLVVLDDDLRVQGVMRSGRWI